jgi:hypothetical protein
LKWKPTGVMARKSADDAQRLGIDRVLHVEVVRRFAFRG